MDEVPKMRAMTMMGLCFYLDIGTSTFHDYKQNEDFSEVIAKIEQVIFTQKFEGAAADLLNANIISRALGILPFLRGAVIHQNKYYRCNWLLIVMSLLAD